jgi:hypothetical protein
MPELHSNGIYEAYLAELFNPLAGGTQFNPATNPMASGFQFNTGAMGGIGGAGIGAGPQTPWTTPTYPQQAFPQQAFAQQIYPQQLGAQWPQQGSPTQILPAVVQHIATKQAVQAIQLTQVLHALQQIVHTIAAQQQQLVQTLAQVTQPQFGYGAGGHGGNPFTQTHGQVPGFGQVPGVGFQTPVSQALQQQAMQQLLQYLGVQQQTPFRYGMAA